MEKKQNGGGLTADEKIKALISYVPASEENKKAYIETVKKQVLGVDKQGNERPFQDLFFFMSVAKQLNLNPLKRQIYAVYRWNKKTQKEEMTIQTGIDGYRATATRTGEYAGQDEPVFDTEEAEHPNKATVTVYRIVKGVRVPFSASARWNEYVVTDYDGNANFQWKSKPYLMLSKCAEALALRKAFPEELTGVYTEEEMENSNVIEQDEPLPTPPSIKKKREEREAKKTTIPEQEPEENRTEEEYQEAIRADEGEIEDVEYEDITETGQQELLSRYKKAKKNNNK